MSIVLIIVFFIQTLSKKDYFLSTDLNFEQQIRKKLRKGRGFFL